MSEFSVEDIYRLKEEFNAAVEKAVKAGYRVDVITIHGNVLARRSAIPLTTISVDVYKRIEK